MKFGVREICNVVFKAKSDVKIGSSEFTKGQPVLYIDSAKTSTLEGAGTTVYAQGGRGNTRLIAWEGEKTLTFTVEDALLSPMGFAILSGAGLIKGTEGTEEKIHVHSTAYQIIGNDSVIDLTDALEAGEEICSTAPVYVIVTEPDGSITGNIIKDATVTDIVKTINGKEETFKNAGLTLKDATNNGKTVMVDFYVLKTADSTSEIQIDAENFAGYYYVEADTLFRRQVDGVDMPANITLPNVKIQSNFTFSMASTGDPSTFTFTMDAMPGYTMFDSTKKVLCVIQVVEDQGASAGAKWKTVMGHNADEFKVVDSEGTANDSITDSVPRAGKIKLD
jgi:hypothetical protein